MSFPRCLPPCRTMWFTVAKGNIVHPFIIIIMNFIAAGSVEAFAYVLNGAVGRARNQLTMQLPVCFCTLADHRSC